MWNPWDETYLSVILEHVMRAFKQQQQRWAKGSVQTLKELLPRVLASDLPWWIKVESTFHLTANLAYPLLVMLAALLFPAMVMRYNAGVRTVSA